MNGTCYMNGSEWPHCCCPLANNVEYIDRGQAWVYPKMPLPAGVLNPQLTDGSLGPHMSTQNGISICSSFLSDSQTHRQTTLLCRQQ